LQQRSIARVGKSTRARCEISLAKAINATEVDLATPRFEIYGHRGSPRRAVENTMASVRLAIEEGADGCEVDLRRLVDGTIALYHDDTVASRTVEHLTREELQGIVREVATLPDLRQSIPSSNLVLEVKRAGYERELAAAVSAWDGITVSSFDHRVIVSLREAGYTGETGIVYDGYIVGAAGYAAGLGASRIYPRYPYVDVELVRAAHHQGIRVIPWTANRPGDWARLRELGCDGVITDYPAEAVAWRGA
jgi:glycerophosphoryl diester phosphodiesterase